MTSSKNITFKDMLTNNQISKQFERGRRDYKTDAHTFQIKQRNRNISHESGKCCTNIGKSKENQTKSNVHNISEIAWPELPKPKSYSNLKTEKNSQPFCENKATESEPNKISQFQQTENETMKDISKRNDESDKCLIPRMSNLAISLDSEVPHFSNKSEGDHSEKLECCNNGAGTSEQNISREDSSRSMQQKYCDGEQEDGKITKHLSASQEETTCDENNVQKKRTRNRNTALKEEKKRLREEEIRRKMLAPKGERVRLVDQKMLETLLNNKADSTSNVKYHNMAPSMNETEFPTVQESRKQRLKSNEPAKQHIEVEINARSKKRKDAIQIDLLNLIKSRPSSQHKKAEGDGGSKVQSNVLRYSGNQLDSSNPERKRGKMKEGPKKKRPTTLKSAILEERMLRRNHGACQEQTVYVQDGPESKENQCVAIADNSEAVQSEPSVIQQVPELPLKLSIHSRKFRDYCDHFVTAELNSAVRLLLKDVIKFQDRQYQRDPVKAFAKRRYVSGLREVKKYLNLKKLKLIVVAPDLEVAKVKGGLDEIVEELKTSAAAQGVNCMFALSRRELGFLTYKKVGVSCIGICSYEGSEQNFQQVMERLAEAKRSYEMEMSAESVTETVTGQVIASLLSKFTETDASPFLSVIEQKASLHSD